MPVNWIVSGTLVSIVAVLPGRFMVTSSPGPGTKPVLQLAALVQKPSTSFQLGLAAPTVLSEPSVKSRAVVPVMIFIFHPPVFVADLCGLIVVIDYFLPLTCNL